MSGRLIIKNKKRINVYVISFIRSILPVYNNCLQLNVKSVSRYFFNKNQYLALLADILNCT